MQPRHRYHVSLKEGTALCKIEFVSSVLFVQKKHSELQRNEDGRIEAP
ncbi:hypothetical protein M514_14223 [Trichuris suis]|uniref:Uncharacterized protein n=1 Tax=Trichuris suis TaxID=68888 RepID=A0A085LIV4_9BILA|nr:hypothetical protein M513_14223 [Trichuris suis]KFD59314.1 hypothetical protein M514_14223 [Trichuris suis]